MKEKIWFLKRPELFERLSDAERSRLERRAVMRSFRRGEIIYFPTDPGQSVLVLAQGLVKLKALSPDGKETILAFVEEGELFGELALVDEEPRREYAEAAADARVIAIPRDDVLALMQQRSDIALYVTRLVGFRRRRIENRLRNLLFRSLRERIAALLLELIDDHGERHGQAWNIRLRLSHQELASLIGATREAVSATLSRLQAEGIVLSQRRRITVLDRARLAREVQAEAAPFSPRPRISVR